MSFLNARSFDNGEVLISMLSTYWSIWFPDQQALKNLMNAVGAAYYENHVQTEDAFNTFGVSTVPVKTQRNWREFELSDSLREDSDALKNLYGGGVIYGGSVYYGDLEEFDDAAGYPLPNSFDTCKMLFSGVTNPNYVWVEGFDFHVDTSRRIIIFREDPLSNSALPVRNEVDESGAVVNRTLRLWARDAEEDKQHIYEHYGHVVGVQLESSSHYREFVEALWAALVQGPSRMSVKLAAAALTGIPFAQDTEVVRAVNATSLTLDIITDKNAYSFKPTAESLVSVGDQLSYGDTLVDSVRILEPGAITDWSDIRGMSIGKRFSSLPTAGPVVVENKDVNLTYAGTDYQGRTIVQFDVKGWGSDPEDFWDEVHRQGVNRGKTLAQMLDTRVNQVGEPAIDDMPDHVNPFEFVIGNLFHSNLYIFVLKPADFADGAPGMSLFGHLVKYLPPHTAFMIFVEMRSQTDYYDAGDVADTDPEFLRGLPIDETVSYTMLTDHGPTLRTIPENCR